MSFHIGDNHTSNAAALDTRRFSLDLGPTAQPIQDPAHIGCHLDAGSNEAETTRRLVDIDMFEAFLGQGQGCTQATHA